MDREDLRLEVILLLTDEGPMSAQGVAQRIAGTASPTEVRGCLMNLRKEGLVERSEQFGGTNWNARTSTIEEMLAESLDDISSIDTDPK